jgi:hypothetical protein
MSFEKQALQVVNKVIAKDTSSFYNGTLFVEEISSVQAAKIETSLINEFKCGIIVSRQSVCNFSFDFI